MITIFECTADGCANQGIVYRMEDANPIAMCGGCKETLIGTPETKEQ